MRKRRGSRRQPLATSPVAAVVGGGGGADTATSPQPEGAQAHAAARPRADAGRHRHAPGSMFPATERARLSNGIQVVYARRAAVPVTRVAVEFDAGIAADPASRLGTQAMMLNMLEEGTTHLNSTQLAEAQERLGANIGTGASLDRTTVSLTALSTQLGAVARSARRRDPQPGLRPGGGRADPRSSSSPASPPR